MIKGEISWHPVIHDSYWMIPLNKIFLDDKDSEICNNNCAAILDSGTSLITGPENDLVALTQKLGDADCTHYRDMPDMKFMFSDNDSFSLTPDEYVVTLHGEDVEFYDHSNNIDDCAGTFMPFNILFEGKKVWIMGDVFMSKYVVIFDRGNNRIGIAQQAD